MLNSSRHDATLECRLAKQGGGRELQTYICARFALKSASNVDVLRFRAPGAVRFCTSSRIGAGRFQTCRCSRFVLKPMEHDAQARKTGGKGEGYKPAHVHAVLSNLRQDVLRTSRIGAARFQPCRCRRFGLKSSQHDATLKCRLAKQGGRLRGTNLRMCTLCSEMGVKR